MTDADLSLTIEPKSDQLNADDLITGPLDIVVTGVSAEPSSSEQPVAISFEGDRGKPYKPCKSMRRLLVNVWGAKGAAYVGKRMRLYRDASVKFGGIEVGGIRISHMSGLDAEQSVALTVTRGRRAPYTVKPMPPTVPDAPPIDVAALEAEAREVASLGTERLRQYWTGLGATKQNALAGLLNDLKAAAADADGGDQIEPDPAPTAQMDDGWPGPDPDAM